MSEPTDLDNPGSRLTPRAAEMLRSLLEDFRDEVLQSAARRGLGLEISARDVIEAFEERTGDSRRYVSLIAGRSSRLQLILVTYAAIAGALGVAAVFVAIADGTDSPATSVLAGMSTALVLASLALILLYVRRERAASERLRVEIERQGGFASFMERWLRIESLLRLLVARDLGTSAAEMTLSDVLDASQRLKSIDRATSDNLRRLLKIRNEAVHGRDLDQRTLVTATQEADRLLLRFEDELAR